MTTSTPTDDHYTLLGVTPDVSDKDLAKAYKRAALIWHPDKNVTRMEEAATMFDLIRKSYDVLSDPTQRASFDQKKRAEIAAKERDAKLTGKRKQMKEDLKRREQESAAAAAAAAARAKSSSFAGGPPPRKKSKTSQAVDELRKQSELQRRARDRMMEARADAGRAHLQQAPRMTATAPAIVPVPATVQQQVDERSSVVVVKWKRKRQTTTTQTTTKEEEDAALAEYSAASLKDMLEKYCGPIENIILGKKGNRAVVEFTSFSSVEKAVRHAGALHLKITPQENGDSKEKKKKVVMKSNVAAAAPGTMATADFEASVLAKLRRS